MKITVGEVYRIRMRTGERTWVVRVRCIEKLEHFAVFEHANGYRECWSYWELERCVI